MLVINGVPIPDLHQEVNFELHKTDINAGIEQFVQQTNPDDDIRPQILQQLIAMSTDLTQTVSRKTWVLAVRAVYSATSGMGLLGSERLKTSAVKAAPKIQMAMDSVNWANCGKTADNILNALAAKAFPEIADAKVKAKVKAKAQSFKAGQGRDVYSLLNAVPTSGIMLFDCSFPQVHTFLIEVNASGQRFLCQGYQGAYYASWWASNDERALVLTKEKDFPAPDLDRVLKKRDLLGMTVQRPANPEEFEIFLGTLGKALDAGPWAKFVELWLDLPFCPITRERDSVSQRGDEPQLLITTYAITTPPQAAPADSGSFAAAVIPRAIS